MTTNTELLKSVIDGLINEDDESAKTAFKQYATHKFKTILENDDKEEKDDDEKEEKDDKEDSEDCECDDDDDKEEKEDKED